MTLQQQLEYFWERGFYSVVKDKWDDYYVVSTKSFSGAFFVTEPHIAIDAAKHQVGNSKEYQDYLLDQMADAKNGGWKIIENETFHPSELMGKGFQVGDKALLITDNSGSTKEVEIKRIANFGTHLLYILKNYPLGVAHYRLKPVLPVEENKNCMKCGVYVSENDIGVIRTETDYLCCLSCDREVNKVIELLKKTKVITDGKIVNF